MLHHLPRHRHTVLIFPPFAPPPLQFCSLFLVNSLNRNNHMPPDCKAYLPTSHPVPWAAGIGALAGGLAGGFTNATLHPIDTVKTKLQTKGSSTLYKGPIDVVKKVKRPPNLLTPSGHPFSPIPRPQNAFESLSAIRCGTEPRPPVSSSSSRSWPPKVSPVFTRASLQPWWGPPCHPPSTSACMSWARGCWAGCPAAPVPSCPPWQPPSETSPPPPSSCRKRSSSSECRCALALTGRGRKQIRLWWYMVEWREWWKIVCVPFHSTKKYSKNTSVELHCVTSHRHRSIDRSINQS